MIIQVENRTVDAPYSDTYCNLECWTVIGSQKKSSYPMVKYTAFYQVKFEKFCIVKSIINSLSEETNKQYFNNWLQHAESNGHFLKKG